MRTDIDETNRDRITHKTRKVQIERATSGFGFVLRGAKADGPISEFTPCPTCPAVQYLESVDQNGPAWAAGLRPGDFIIEINGISVIRAGHRQAVELIRSTTGTLRLTASSVIAPKKDESRTATVKQRPQVRTYGPAEIQDILARQQPHPERNTPSGTPLGTSIDKPRIPKIPDTMSFDSSTPSSMQQIRNSRSISPSPSTNSDQSTNSSGLDKDKKPKPPPPKRKESRLISTSVSEMSSPTPLDTQQKMYRSRNSSTGGGAASVVDDDSNSTSLNTFKSPAGSFCADDSPTVPVSCSPIRQNVESEKPKPPPVSAKPSKMAKVCSQEQLMSEMNSRLKQRQENGVSDDVFEEPVKNYSNIHDIDKELEEIKNRTKTTDPTSAFAIAMSAKHKTLTKKREKLKRNIPTVEEINSRLIQESTKNEEKKNELQYSSEESGPDAVMRRFLDSPSKYPFDIPEPILDSGVETIGSNSTGSDREEAKHQQFLQLKQNLKARSSVSTWSSVDVCDWLAEHGYEQYTSSFQENEIEGSHLTTLTRDDLTELGIIKLGHKIGILSMIEKAKGASSS